MNGWLTAKKRGRDDEAIERDRAAAVQARKQRRGGGKPAAAAKGKPKSKKSKKKKAQKGWKNEYALSDEDSLAEFVVDDDEEEEGEETELDSAEEESLDDDDEQEIHEILNDDDDDKSDSEPDTFFRPYKKRTSRPPPPRPLLGNKKTKPKARRRKPAKKDKAAAKPVNLCGDSSDSDVQILETKPVAAKPSAFQSDESSDNDWTTRSPARNGGKAAAVPDPHGGKAAAAPKQSAINDDSDRSDDDHDCTTTSSRPTQASTSNLSRLFGGNQQRDKNNDDDETPFLPTAIRKSSKKRYQIQDDEDESTHSPFDSPPRNDARNDDYDEDLAVALALSQSQAESETKARQRDKDEPETEDFLGDDDSNHDHEDEEDDYIDPAAREARSVLATANELSRQIMSTLTAWSGSVSSTTPTMGMITANGAVSLSTMAGDVGGAVHDWISKEKMASICPNVTLAEYQLIGVNWMALLHGMKCHVEGSKKHTNVNGILADEMGLGKTVQTICFLCWLHHQSRSGVRNASDAISLDDDDSSSSSSSDDYESKGHCPHLVIAPASVIANWERELKRFAPQLNVVKYHGNMTEREDLQYDLRVHLPGQRASRLVEPLDVILAPITYFQKEKSDDRNFLRKFRYSYLIVDEAHQLKNARGTRYKTLDKFCSEHRLLLTGTPVQNSPQELLSLLCFLMPLFSRSSDYDNEAQNDGGQSMLQHFVSMESGANSTSAEAYQKLKQLFAPFVLRRRKQDVLSQMIPPKIQKVEFVELDPVARDIYDSLLSAHVKAKKNGDRIEDHLFTQLRKAAHHPLLLRSRHVSEADKKHLCHFFHLYGAFRGEGCTKEKVYQELERFSDFEIHLTALDLIQENPMRRPDLERYTLTTDDLYSSAKFVCLRNILPSLIAEGHRILIFSVWTTCLDLLTCLLDDMEIQYLRMEGSTPVEERQSLIDKFNNCTSIPVFLLSTKACGLGINLTSADTCIFHDLDFNPMNDAQAEDRCHRIGQEKEVTVIRLVSKDSVDHDIYEMQQRKAKMSQVIMATNGSESDNNWSKEAAKAKELVLQTAVDRFLKSPAANRKLDKENDDSELSRDDL